MTSHEHHPIATAAQPVATITHRFRLPCPPRRAFDLFADPRRLDRLTPPWFRLRPLNGVPTELGPGTEIAYRLRWRGIPLRWSSVITEWREPELITYEQRRGPYGFFRHRHLFREVAGGTEVTDRVVYRAPGGRLADRWIVRPDLRRIFRWRELEARRELQLEDSSRAA